MATSAVPPALAALVDILQSSPDLSGVQVSDGPPEEDLDADDLVVVGWQPGAESAVEITQDFAYAGARTRDENFLILCYLDSGTGDTDIATRRARAYDLLAVVENALRATQAAPTAPTLNGTVLWAHLVQAALMQQRTENGTQVGINFSIACRARI